jgi:DNA replication protein DnaC
MIADELTFSNTPEKRAAHANLVQQSRRSMQQHNPAALHIFDEIAERIDSQNGGGSFIDAKAGCGKTFLAKALLSYVRQHAKVSSMFISYAVK